MVAQTQKTKDMATFCLFAGRHELPTNEGAICTEFDFATKKVVKSELWQVLLNEGGKLLVTGLTPALTEFLAEFSAEHRVRLDDIYHCPEKYYNSDYQCPRLTLLHFDAATKEYWEQECF